MVTKLGISLREYAVSIISVDGLNFNSFLPLFGHEGLNIPVSALTDSDPGAACYPEQNDPTKLSDAAKTIKALESGKIKVFFSQKTFEYDLCLPSDNHAAILQAFSEIHPRLGAALTKRVQETSDPSQKCKLIFDELKSSSLKGEYAQTLAEVIEKSPRFSVPAYIHDAIKHVCN